MAARPATRTIRERPVENAQPRPAVRDLSRGPASFTIDWDVRPAFDFVFSLSGDAGATDDLPAEDRAWLSDTKATMPPEIEVEFKRLFESELCIHVPIIAIGRPEIRTAADLVAAVEATPYREVLLGLFDEGPGDQQLIGLVAQALDGDQTVMPAIEEALPDWKREARLGVIREPEQTVANLLVVLRWWEKAFTPIEARITDIIERDYEMRSTDRETLAPVDLIERTTGGIRWLPEAGVKRVILAPSYFSRPYNFLMNACRLALLRLPRRRRCARGTRPARGPAGGRPAPPRTRRRDTAADPEAARRAGPVPHGDRPAARPVQANDQAPPGPAAVRRPGDDHGVGDRHLLLPPPEPARRRLGGHQAVPHRLDASPTQGGQRAADQSRGPLAGLNVR